MQIKNIKQFDENSGYWAELERKLEKEDAKFYEKEAQREKKFIEDHKQDRDNLAALEDALTQYAEENKKEMFAEQKTYKNDFIEISLRKSAQSVKYLKSWTQQKVIDRIKAEYKNLITRFINEKESVNKTAIKAAVKSGEFDDKKLKQIGMRTSQNENINLKLK